MGKKSRVNMSNMDRHLLRVCPKALLHTINSERTYAVNYFPSYDTM